MLVATAKRLLPEPMELLLFVLLLLSPPLSPPLLPQQQLLALLPVLQLKALRALQQVTRVYQLVLPVRAPVLLSYRK